MSERDESLTGRVQALETQLKAYQETLESHIKAYKRDWESYSETQQSALRKVVVEVERWAHYSPGKSARRERLGRNMAVGASLTSIGAGCWWVYPPLALLVVGGIMFVGCCVGHILTRNRPRRQTDV